MKLKPGEYYAVCSSVGEGMFRHERQITIGTNKENLLVDESSLKLSLDGFVVAIFYLDHVKNGLAHGVVYNCLDGFLSGIRDIPIDSLTSQKRVRKYDGREYNLRT